MPGLVQNLQYEPVSDGEMAACTARGITCHWRGGEGREGGRERILNMEGTSREKYREETRGVERRGEKFCIAKEE